MVSSVTPQQASALIAQGEVDVVDVREPGEWAGGHLAGARLIPMDRLRASFKAGLIPSGVIFVCAAGIRSQTAAKLAEESGLTRIYNLSGGTRSWVKAGLPIVRELATGT